jgi:DNA-binding NtrC family response regulator
MQVKSNYETEITVLGEEVQKLLSRLNEYEFERVGSVQEARRAVEIMAASEIDSNKKGYAH